MRQIPARRNEGCQTVLDNTRSVSPLTIFEFAHNSLTQHYLLCLFVLVMVKNGKPKAKSRRPVGRQVRPGPRKGTRYSRPLQQGVGRVPNGGIQNRHSGAHRLCCYADALHDSHLPLPRAIGGYSVVRTTDSIQTDSKCCLFGAFKHQDGNWSNILGVAAVNSALSMGAANNTFIFQAPGVTNSTLGTASTLVPAAVTVQIMNPEALQTTTGIVMSGIMNQVPRLSGDTVSGGVTRTWDAFANEFVSFNKPRLMSAGKLALRGVQASTIPMNMSSLSEFTNLTEASNNTGSWTFFDCEGMAPLVVSNPSGISLSYLVTVEWRLRFDISNPAASTHVTRPPASDHTWGSLIKQMQAFGHGVKDIADVVADIGVMASRSPLALAM